MTIKRIDVEEIGPSINFKTSIADLINTLHHYEDAGWTNISSDWDNGDHYYICKYRLETDEEYNTRLKEREQEVENRRALYEDLKKEFGDS